MLRKKMLFAQVLSVIQSHEEFLPSISISACLSSLCILSLHICWSNPNSAVNWPQILLLCFCLISNRIIWNSAHVRKCECTHTCLRAYTSCGYNHFLKLTHLFLHCVVIHFLFRPSYIVPISKVELTVLHWRKVFKEPDFLCITPHRTGWAQNTLCMERILPWLLCNSASQYTPDVSCFENSHRNSEMKG